MRAAFMRLTEVATQRWRLLWCPSGPHRFVTIAHEGRDLIGARTVRRFRTERCEKCGKVRQVDLP